MKQIVVIAMIVATLAAGCASDPYAGSKTDLKGIAAAAAAKDGFKLEEYDFSQLRAGKIDGDKGWWVDFVGKEPIPGNYFSVWVNERTLGTQVFPGE